MHWRSAIAEISNISLDAQSIDLWEGFDPVEAIHIMLDDCYRDRLNASWQAKLGATPSIPQPIPQR